MDAGAAPRETAEEFQAYVKKLVGKWAKPVPHLLGLTDFSRVHLWRSIDVDLAPRFHQGNLALVGDAAPILILSFAGQGVSSAIADAVALAHLVNMRGSLATALVDYSRQRHEQCAPFIQRGRELMQEFLAPLAPRGMALPIA